MCAARWSSRGGRGPVQPPLGLDFGTPAMERAGAGTLATERGRGEESRAVLLRGSGPVGRTAAGAVIQCGILDQSRVLPIGSTRFGVLHLFRPRLHAGHYK